MTLALTALTLAGCTSNFVNEIDAYPSDNSEYLAIKTGIAQSDIEQYCHQAPALSCTLDVTGNIQARVQLNYRFANWDSGGYEQVIISGSVIPQVKMVKSKLASAKHSGKAEPTLAPELTLKLGFGVAVEQVLAGDTDLLSLTHEKAAYGLSGGRGYRDKTVRGKVNGEFVHVTLPGKTATYAVRTDESVTFADPEQVITLLQATNKLQLNSLSASHGRYEFDIPLSDDAKQVLLKLANFQHVINNN
ncbi:hypothetical protein EXU30_18675 [Shewanella maritima]|uniref:Uncharacterized protein n=1 Tax=Shewanella maritima TaxID=2520507 RepID=A0A411PLQ4_9GAMM|nr:hypothetical protein [Shewanella maritima]QBF84462.1 hypothetical protein EXU30_18675 [Shewanella maritima]